MSAVMQSSTRSASHRMSLRGLLRGIAPDALLPSIADIEITNISADSRQVGPGGLFLALRGLKSHGVEYAARAVQRGAIALCWEPAQNVQPPPVNIATAAIPDLSAHIGALADRFFVEPSAALRIAAITGTNGKTTTAHVLAVACEKLGMRAGYMGTLGYGPLGALQPSDRTTPDCISVHRQLAELCDARVGTVGMEVSSHALDQGRIDAVRIDTTVFTNLSRDHLDYHGTMDAYGAAKARLFRWPGLHSRIINAGDEFGRALLKERVGARTIAYSVHALQSAAVESSIHARQVRATDRGLELDVDGSWGACTLRSPLLGEFNAENLLAALGVLLSWDVPLTQAAAALEKISAPAGRMELHAAAGKRAVVDYAHSPDALEKVLRALRQHCHGKLICVFGCGGDRDRGKRPLMGAAAERLADRVILTDDNPRSEQSAEIVAEILAGMLRSGEVLVEHDRASAIHSALAECGADDLVLIAGKGHEDYQIVGPETRHFSDAEVVRQVLGGAT